MMLQALMKSNPGSDYIYVVDTRPKVTLFIARIACMLQGAEAQGPNGVINS